MFSAPGSQSQYNKLDSGGLGAHSEGAAVATAAASAGNADLAATAATNLAEKFSPRPKFPTILRDVFKS